MAVKNSFAMSFKRPVPMSGSASGFSGKGSISAPENPFLKKSINLRESNQRMDTRELSEDLN